MSKRVAVRKATRPLLTGLVGYWTLDETSGDRADRIAGNDWVASATLGYAAGIGGGNAMACAQGALDNGVLNPCPAALDFAGAQSFTVALWMYQYTFTEPSPCYHRLIHHAYETTEGGEWAYNGYGFMAINNEGIAAYIGNGLSESGPWIHVYGIELNKWHWILLEHNADTQTACIYRDTVAGQTRACPDGWRSATSQPVTLGATSVGPPDNTMDGRIDEVAIWSRVLTAEEKAWLYNEGAGRTYANILAYGG